MNRRSKIRVPKRGMGRETSDFESHWTVLAASLREIHTKDASNLSFEELYRTTYQLMLHPPGSQLLHGRVVELEKNWLSNDVHPRVAASVTPNLLVLEETAAPDQVNEGRDAAERFLSQIREVWEDHQLCMGLITDVLMYMDRVVVAEKRGYPIYAMAMALFRDYVLRGPVGVSNDLTVACVFESTVLFMIRLEREGAVIDRSLVRHCIYMLEGLHESDDEDESGSLYFITFEPTFLEASAKFYVAEGHNLLATADASTFCKRVAARIDEEEERCRFTLSAPTAPKIQAVINESLIKQNVEEVIDMEDSGVKFMLDNDRLDDLRNVYTLVSRIDPKKVALTRTLQTRVIELGEKVNSAAREFLQPNKPNPPETAGDNGKGKAADEKSPINVQTAAAIKWVDDVLQLKRKFDKVWEEPFCRDQIIQTALTASFGDFININTRSAEYLSLFLDENLKKGVKGKSDDEIDSLLNDGITLLRYIRDKDLFETYYKKHLSRRLLMKRSASMDVERQMITKMKMEVGNTFTQRLEAMFKDIAVSSDLTVSHQKLVTERGAADPKRIELDMSVLTSTIWPMEIMGGRKEGIPVPNCVFPADVEKVKRSFEEFYLNKHTGRKLTWQPGMGTADIRATFVRPNGQVQRHELNVSTYAMVILLQFNDLDPGESLSFEDLKANTNIPENDLIRNLQSLAVAPKTRVLKKDPMSKDVKPTDRFYFNSEFQSKFTKLKIGVVSAGANKLETKNERSETEKKANDERAGSVEAAVVRVMKQRKNLAHSQLLTEVISQLASRFSPDVNMIKKRIESLIDREYLERIPGSNPPSYRYLA